MGDSSSLRCISPPPGYSDTPEHQRYPHRNQHRHECVSPGITSADSDFSFCDMLPPPQIESHLLSTSNESLTATPSGFRSYVDDDYQRASQSSRLSRSKDSILDEYSISSRSPSFLDYDCRSPTREQFHTLERQSRSAESYDARPTSANSNFYGSMRIARDVTLDDELYLRPDSRTSTGTWSSSRGEKPIPPAKPANLRKPIIPAKPVLDKVTGKPIPGVKPMVKPKPVAQPSQIPKPKQLSQINSTSAQQISTIKKPTPPVKPPRKSLTRKLSASGSNLLDQQRYSCEYTENGTLKRVSSNNRCLDNYSTISSTNKDDYYRTMKESFSALYDEIANETLRNYNCSSLNRPLGQRTQLSCHMRSKSEHKPFYNPNFATATTNSNSQSSTNNSSNAKSSSTNANFNVTGGGERQVRSINSNTGVKSKEVKLRKSTTVHLPFKSTDYNVSCQKTPAFEPPSPGTAESGIQSVIKLLSQVRMRRENYFNNQVELLKDA